PNHFATLDPPLVPAFMPRGDTWSMAKSEYFQKPFNRWLFTQYYAFPVVRHTAGRTALSRSFDLLKDGHALVIYPEGTRVDAGVLAEPEPGAGFIAQEIRRAGAAGGADGHAAGHAQRHDRAASLAGHRPLRQAVRCAAE